MATPIHAKLSPDDHEKEIKLLATTSGKPHLAAAIDGYQKEWYKRLATLGAGNNYGGIPGRFVNWTSTVLSLGTLGSYAPSREGVLNKKIDEIVAAKTRKDFNATYKLTDVFTRASDKLENLSEKISVCEELEGDITDFLTANKQSIELFDSLRQTVSPGAIARVREGVSNGWERVKDGMRDHPGAGVLGTAAGVGVVAGSAALFGAGVVGGVLVGVPVAAGAAATAVVGVKNMIQNRKSLKATMDQLQEMKTSIATIRGQTEEARQKLFEKITEKYKPEQEVEKKMRELVNLRAPDELVNFETALQDRNPSGALKTFFRALKAKTPAVFHDAMETNEFERYLNTLGNRRAINMRKNANALLGSKDAQGAKEISGFVKRLKEVNDVTGVRGKRIDFEHPAGTHQPFTVNDIYVDGNKTIMIIKWDRDPLVKFAFEVTQTGTTTETKFIRPAVNDLPTIKHGLSTARTNLDPAHGKAAEDLFEKAEKQYLTIDEYKTLSSYFKSGHVPAVIAGIVTHGSVFHQDNVDNSYHLVIS